MKRRQGAVFLREYYALQGELAGLRRLLEQLEADREEFCGSLVRTSDLSRPAVCGGRAADPVVSAAAELEERFDVRRRELERSMAEVTLRRSDAGELIVRARLTEDELKAVEHVFMRLQPSRLAGDAVGCSMRTGERLICSACAKVERQLERGRAAAV